MENKEDEKVNFYDNIFEDLKEILEKGITHNTIILDIENYINKEINKPEYNEFKTFEDIEKFVLYTIKLSYLDGYFEKNIFPLINLETQNLSFLNKIISNINDTNLLGLKKFILYEVEDNFERLNIFCLISIIISYWDFLSSKKPSVLNFLYITTCNFIIDKLIIFLKKKELIFLNKYLIKDYKTVQENINRKILVDSINKNKYEIILKDYFTNSLKMWINYNNIIRASLYVFSNIIILEFIPTTFNQYYNIFDYILLNTYLIFVFDYQIRSIRSTYLNEQNMYKIYKDKIVDLTKDIVNNINIIRENNTYNIESDKNLNLILNLINEAYYNNINLHDYVDSNYNNYEYILEVIGKWVLFGVTTFNPSVSFQLEKIYFYIANLYRKIDKNYTYSIDNRVYEEILNFECKDENTDNLFKENSDNLYTIEGLNHSFNTNKIFEDVNIVIPKNKWICFYGNSGCGKSTLCNILLHKLNPSNGIIKYMGEYSDYEYTNIRDSVSFVNTDPDIFNNTILYNVTYGLKELENEIVMEKVIEKINYYLDLFDLSMYKNNLDKHIDSLSTGQKQRIKIIRCILHDKDIWILDEITSNIDNELEKVILKELKRIQIEKNKSVIHITHNLENIGFSDEKMYIRNYNIYRA